jgi:hypothetical protein
MGLIWQVPDEVQAENSATERVPFVPLLFSHQQRIEPMELDATRVKPTIKSTNLLGGMTWQDCAKAALRS